MPAASASTPLRFADVRDLVPGHEAGERRLQLGSIACRAMTTEVRDAPKRHRYEAIVDGRLAGFAVYRDDGGVRVFVHTEVFPKFESQGVGTALARGALDDVRASGRVLVPQCPFIRSYVERHPDYADLVAPA
jgi:predicted GNAT family acetyltransferase